MYIYLDIDDVGVMLVNYHGLNAVFVSILSVKEDMTQTLHMFCPLSASIIRSI